MKVDYRVSSSTDLKNALFEEITLMWKTKYLEVTSAVASIRFIWLQVPSGDDGRLSSLTSVPRTNRTYQSSVSDYWADGKLSPLHRVPIFLQVLLRLEHLMDAFEPSLYNILCIKIFSVKQNIVKSLHLRGVLSSFQVSVKRSKKDR